LKGNAVAKTIGATNKMPKRQGKPAGTPEHRQRCVDSAVELLLASTPLPADIVRLVIAARKVAFGDADPEDICELDRASEAFASRVPWEDEDGG
jgi:hypothetical protein